MHRLIDLLGSYTFQAHRGGSEEMPENTREGMLYSWQFASAIPETDIRTLADGTLICIHDSTLERTAEAPAHIRTKPVSELTMQEIAQADAGIKYGRNFMGFRIPTLDKLLALMQNHPSRRLYLEVKDASLETVAQMVDEYGAADRIIFIHKHEQHCAEMRKYLPYVKTMTWCGGSVPAVMQRFESLEKNQFFGLSQVQIHLHAWESDGIIATALPEDFLRHAIKRTGELGVDLQICPKPPSPLLLMWLMNMGVRWFVSDAPMLFTQMMRDALCLTRLPQVLPMQVVFGGQSSEFPC